MNETVIGLEVHVQLNTKTKLFCSCTTESSKPNSSTCPICLGMPGAKPSLNEKAVELAVKVATALGCRVNVEFFFSRKTYFYPDLANNFQITQYELPIGVNGFLKLKSGKKISLKRIHLEEDPAALVHEKGLGESEFVLVDYNRSGTPLLEIVSDPVIESAEEAREFLNELLTSLQYLNVFVPGKNTLKTDSNISLKGGERVEVKNISSIKAVEKALGFEILRQKNNLKEGKKIERETRAFDEATQTTRTLRTKETEEDYGYITEPNLSQIILSKKFLGKIRKEIPELHSEKAKRFVKKYKISEESAWILCSDLDLSNLFEEVAKKVSPSLTALFLQRELLSILNYDDLSIKEAKIDSKKLAGLLMLLEKKKITEKSAKDAMIKAVHEKIDPVKYIISHNFVKEMSEKEIEKIVDKILSANPDAVKDYLAGEKKSLNFLVGKVLKETKGKAEPRLVQEKVLKFLKK